MKNFTKLFTLLTMAAMSMGVWAGDFNGSNYNKQATVPGTIDLSYGSYTGWNRDSFFSNASKMENSKSGAVAQFSFTVSDAAAFLFSLQASNGNGYGDYNCDLQVKIWSTSAEEPLSPNTTFTVEDDNNWNNFVNHYYTTPVLTAGDYYLKIIWTDQANVQNIKFENYESKLITPSTTAISLMRANMIDYYFKTADREKDQTPLGFMNVGDYIEYPVSISNSEYMVSFEASIKEGSTGVITVSLINASTDTRMDIPVDVAVSGNWSTYLSYKTWFSSMAAGVYILRVAWTSGTAANFQNLKIRDISSIVITSSSSAMSLNKADMADYKFNNALEKDQDPLGYMTEGDYIEYPVSISSADDFFVTFKASIKDIDGAVMSVSFTEANTANMVTKAVSVLRKSGWGDYTRYVALFPELTAGSYWLRITWTSQNPNFGSLKLMGTADYKYTIGGSEVNLSTDWKTKALIEIRDSHYKEHDNVEYTGNNDNLNFILYNLYSSPLDLSFEASTDKDDASIVLELLNEDGSVLSSEAKSITRKGWSTFAEYTVTGINTTAGYQVLRLRFENNGSNVRNIKVTPKVYLRTHPHMNLNTLCFPYQIDNYEGATFYTILETEVNGSNELTKLVLEEHVGALEAGVPYFYDPEGSELVCYYSGASTDASTAANGALVGFFDDDYEVPSGSYVTVNNQLYKCGAGVTMGANRAYVTATTYTRAAVPGRKRLTIGGNKIPTGMESIQPSEISSQKILRNGQVIIIRGDKKYNMLGQEL